MEEQIEPVDGIQLLRSYLLHCRHVRASLRTVTQALENRAEAHDTSKLMGDEFAGFSRINKAAREHPYGSPEYRAGLKAEKPTIDLHYARNSHHPEHGKALGEAAEHQRGLPDDATYWAAYRPMTLLDIIEMVCDWRGAYLAYGSQGTWEENMDRQRDRYKVGQQLTKEQWWVIDQVSALLVPQ